MSENSKIVATYNHDLLRGDTHTGFLLKLEVDNDSGGKDPVDITGWEFKAQFSRGRKRGRVYHEASTSGGGMTITDAAAGEFTLDAFQTNGWQEGEYYYDIQSTAPPSTVRTHLRGVLSLLGDVTETPGQNNPG